MKGFIAKLSERFSKDTWKRYVDFDNECFSIVLPKEDPVFINWSDAREVFAFKQDLFSVDQICLGFVYDEDDQYVWVGEEDIGFEAFRAEVERRYGITPNWFAKVMQPPFAENRTTLWTKPSV